MIYRLLGASVKMNDLDDRLRRVEDSARENKNALSQLISHTKVKITMKVLTYVSFRMLNAYLFLYEMARVFFSYQETMYILNTYLIKEIFPLLCTIFAFTIFDIQSIYNRTKIIILCRIFIM